MISRLCALFTALLFAALLATSIPASAGQWFTMVGGICTQAIPFTEECHNQHVIAQIQMVDGYVPGTPFSASACCDSSPIETFLFALGINNGVFQGGSDFSSVGIGPGLSGVMSDIPGQSAVYIHWFDGYFFEAAGGDWIYGQDIPLAIYSGTFTDWLPGRIPEPPSLALILAGLLALISVQSRRSRMV